MTGPACSDRQPQFDQKGSTLRISLSELSLDQTFSELPSSPVCVLRRLELGAQCAWTAWHLVPVGAVWQTGADQVSLARQLAGKGFAGTKAPVSPGQVGVEGEKRSHVARAVSFQQNLVKTSDNGGRRFRAGVRVEQWRLSAAKPH